MKRTNYLLMFLLIGLASAITIGVLLQRPVDRQVILGASGFLLFTLGWTGMFFCLARELPEHALVATSYVNLGGGYGRRAGARNMFALIRFHFEHHRIDLWSILLIGGVAIWQPRSSAMRFEGVGLARP